MSRDDVVEQIRIEPGTRVHLAERDPAAKLGLGRKADAAADTERRSGRLAELGAMLAASRKRALLVVLQGLDASGKDGAVKHCFGALNPMGIDVTSFKAPTSTELAHDFLWRVHAALPERGTIGIFNRSHYEDVLVVRVEGLVPKDVWEARYDAINAFERHLVHEGTEIVKVHLHISREEQAARFRERLEDPTKAWKFSLDDLEKRKKWDEYATAYEAMLERTSTEHAPWHVVPADRNWVRNAAITRLLVDALERMDLAWPELPAGVREIAEIA
jgi:PPK2 family polyphosphate:nucleotide phosphotransferase